MLSFNFDASKGETPASIAQKRALIAQLMGTPRSPSTLGEGFSALGDGIVANVEGGRARDAETKGQASANSTFSALTGMLTGQGGQTPSSGPSTASDATAALAGGDFMSGLINSESGGNWGALNDEGYGGRLQFGDARLADAAAAGVIAPGVTGAEFSRMSPEQQQAVEAWHFGDIEQQAQGMGLDRYYGQTIAGVPITPESVKAMAHLGGIGGAQKFITSGGQYNPADSNGTRLSDYGSRFGGSSAPAAPVQVASLDPSIGAPAQLPPIGPTGGPPLTAMPQQTAQAAPMAAPAPQQAAPAPVQTAQGPSLQMLMEAAANPWLNDSQKGIINSMIAQEMQRQDPMYQMGLEKSQLELEAMRNPGRKPPIEVGGVLVDPDTFQPVFDSRTPADNGFTLSPGQQRFDAQGNPIASGAPAPAPRPMSPEDRAMWGIPETDTTPYYLDENGQPKPISGGGQTINVGGNNDIGTIPAGMMVTRDAAGNVTGMQAIPGSPAEREAQAAVDAAQAGTNQASRYGNVVVEDIDRALDVLDKDPTWSTGILGQAMGNFKGSNSDRLNNLLDTVRANSAFDRLQAMRDASPTGGALGAVSERELGLLQSAIGSLETGNAEDLAYNLKRLQTIYSEIIDGPKASAPAQSTVPASDIDALLELYK